MTESKFSESQLAELLAESEKVPEIVRDDEFWQSLELMAPDAQTVAVKDRFMRLVANEESQLHVELYARLAAAIAETIRRHGPAEARRRLRPTAH